MEKEAEDFLRSFEGFGTARPDFNAATFRFDKRKTVPQQKKKYKEICPDCGLKKFLTKHHLHWWEYTKYFNIAKRDSKGRLYIDVCRDCHDKHDNMTKQKKNKYGDGWDS